MNLGGLSHHFQIFAEEDLGELLRQRTNDMYNSIQQMNRDDLLNANEPELIESFVGSFTYDPVTIDFDSITMSEREGYRAVHEFGEVRNKRGLNYTFHLPVSGELAILKMIPNPRPMRTASFSFDGRNEISFEVFGRSDDIERVVREKDSILGFIKKQLENANNQVKKYNQAVEDKVISFIKQRKNEILQQMDTISAIGVHISKRPAQEKTG